jgi:hypothetical protein
MGILITISNADFSERAIGFLPPVPEELEYWNYFGGSERQTTRNLAPGKAGAMLKGAPAIEHGYCRFESAFNFVETTVPDMTAATLLCAARAPELGAGSAFMVATFIDSKPGEIGTSLYFQNVTAHISVSRRKKDGLEEAQFSPIHPAELDNWNFYVARFSDERQSVENLTLGVKNQMDGVAPRGKSLQNTYRIGSSWSGIAGPIEIAFAAIYSRAIDDNEVKSVHERAKSYLATRDIVI